MKIKKMKITKTQLREIIREEASRLKKQYILENKKKAIVKELRMLNEEEELDMSDINDMSIEDKAVFSAMNDEEVEDDLSDIIAKYTKQGGDYEGGYKDDVSVSPGYLSEMSADGDIARYENAYEKEGVYINESLLDKYGEMVGRFLDKYGEAMEKMGFGKFIDKYGQKIDDKFGDFVMSCGRTIDDFIEEVHNKFKTKLREIKLYN